MLTSLNPSTEQFIHFIDDLPYGVMLSFPVRNDKGEIIDFEPKLFNKYARKVWPCLKSWHSGATMRELFKEDASNGLLTLYTKVLGSEANYSYPFTKLNRPSLLQSFFGGVLAVDRPYKEPIRKARVSKDFTMKLAQYKALVYEHYIGAIL